jgi:lipopolysaccharide transport system ATP-binding protein
VAIAEKPLIRVQGLGKAYPNLRGRKAKSLRILRTLFTGRAAAPESLRWVFRDLSFEVARGDAVGIIGQNGAGKSTLLKLLTDTVKPSLGTISVDGKVSALLELGMGFHPDFTGRENAYLSGRMQGRSQGEMDSVIDEIKTFSEIGDYFDWPVKTYSSGMYVRLAFAVATAFRPDLLIIDEALAVGDMYFQHKSFARIRKFREEGTTLLFVSHDPGAVKSLCNRAILIGDGRMLKDGAPDDVLDFYNAMIAERENHALIALKSGEFDGRSGNGRARTRAVRLMTRGASSDIFRVGEKVVIEIEYQCTESLPDLVAGILIKDRTGVDVFGTNTWHLGIPNLGLEAGVPRVLRIEVDALTLGPGSYSMTVALHTHSNHLAESYDWWERAAVFQVIPGSGSHFIGVAALSIKPELLALGKPGSEAQETA